MFVLYCPGKLLPVAGGGPEPWTPTLDSLGPTAADAPGALNALENANLKIHAGKSDGAEWRGGKLVGASPAVFPYIWGARPLLRVKFGEIRHELGGGERRYPKISPYPETLPGRGWPPRSHSGCSRCWGPGKSVRVPTGGGFSGAGAIFKRRCSLLLPNPLEMPQNHPPGAATAPLLH